MAGNHLTEQIDGPLNPEYEDVPAQTLAVNFVRSLGAIGRWMYNNDEDAKKPQGYRTSSFVEESDHQIGYAIVIPRVEEIKTSYGGYVGSSIFYTVNRDKAAVVQPPTITEYSTDDDVTTKLNEVINTYTKDEMAISLAILQKIKILVLSEVYESELDKLVYTAISLHGAETTRTLAKMFPKP